MKKIKIITSTFFVSGCLLLIGVQNVLADLLPPDGVDWGTPIEPEPKTFLDLIEIQHIAIGGIVLVIVVISFAVLFKITKK